MPEIEEHGQLFWAGLAAMSAAGSRSRPGCTARIVKRQAAWQKTAVYSSVCVSVPIDPAFARDVPYVIVTVPSVDPCARIVERLLNGHGSALQPRTPLRVKPYRLSEDVILPAFAPTNGAAQEDVQ